MNSEDRRGYLGGSDAAAVMGLSPWSTPVELFLEKTGRAPPRLIDPAQAKRYARGTRLEPFIVEMTVDKLQSMGLEVELLAKNQRYTDPDYPFMSCEIDFELRVSGVVEINDTDVEFDREHIHADAKSVTGFARKKWGFENTEDVPIEYGCQFLHGLGIRRRRYCLVAALRSFDDVDIYWTIADDESIAAIRAKEILFWNEHVLTGIPPDPMKFSDIKALFPIDDGTEVEATPELAEQVGQLKDLKQRIALFEEARDELVFQIGNHISPHTWLTFGGQRIMSWKAQRQRRLNLDALRAAWPDIAEEFTVSSTIRVLREVRSKQGRFK